MRWIAVIALLLPASACTSSTAPSSPIAGTWSEQFSIPGPRLVLTLDASGSGNGTYAIEAGRSGTVQVSGDVAAAVVTLTIRYDYGAVRTFTGTLADTDHLTGTFNDVQGTAVFIRS